MRPCDKFPEGCAECWDREPCLEELDYYQQEHFMLNEEGAP